MAAVYKHLDPTLAHNDSLPPLSDDKAPDGKSLVNPPTGVLSPWYTGTPEVFTEDRSDNIFDFHIYYNMASQVQVKHARALHERIRREFPELRVYKFWEQPVGPHPTAMFEVNTFTPHQTGALMTFLVAYRGDLSVLIHPNTDDPLRDHTERATWMGERYPLIVDVLRRGDVPLPPYSIGRTLPSAHP